MDMEGYSLFRGDERVILSTKEFEVLNSWSQIPVKRMRQKRYIVRYGKMVTGIFLL